MSLLPGGICEGEGRRRGFAFRPLTGEVEMAIEDLADGGGAAPAQVTAILQAALREVGGRAPDRATVAGLSVGDRSFLLRELLLLVGHRDHWRSCACPDCGRRFDVHVPLDRLPVRVASEYPEVAVPTPRGPRRYRVPTGADQEALAELGRDGDDGDGDGGDDGGGGSAALRALLARCQIAPGPDDPPTGDEIALIDARMEASFPHVARRAGTACPECGAAAEVEIDLLAILLGRRSEVASEVYTLAAALHWSEEAILSLPRWRRLHYVRMADHARGLATADPEPAWDS
jgi:hypothetical protein